MYPTLRRKPARIGDAQGGTTLPVERAFGFAGARRAGRLDRRRRADRGGCPGHGVLASRNCWRSGSPSNRRSSCAVRRSARRRSVDGKAPAPRTTTLPLGAGSKAPLSLGVSYDETQSRLDVTWSSDPDGSGVISAWLHIGTAEKPGAARYRLYGADGARSGSVVLSHIDRRALSESRLLVRVYRRGEPRPLDLPLSLRP